MIELTGIGSIFRGMSFLYWLLAIAALALVAWKVKRRTYKAIGFAAVIGLFSYLPAQAWQEAQRRESEAQKREAYAREAWAYFKKLCDEKSGEKIYKTYTGVKSVLVVKPLPPATEKDLYDQFWYGDPYSGGKGDQATSSAVRLIGSLETRGFKPSSPAERMGFEFVEVNETIRAERHLAQYTVSPEGRTVRLSIERPVSRFGVSWEDISTPEDRKYWVAGSRLWITDLTDNSLIAERIGYFIESGFGSTAGQRRPWLTSRGPNTTCPRLDDLHFNDRFFIQKVLNPATEKSNGR